MAGHHLNLSFDVLNLFNTQTYDIEYYYESQMKTESSSVNGYMVHPGEPRSIRLTLSYKY
ncbi:MAG: TonB-dependent receptor [Thiovulaceae bacterium]|nr:TonB-dependent receptor [Sulfurimonadaceae bacterium]